MVVAAEPGRVVWPVQDLEMFVEPHPRNQDFEAEDDPEDGQSPPPRRITWLRVLVSRVNCTQHVLPQMLVPSTLHYRSSNFQLVVKMPCIAIILSGIPPLLSCLKFVRLTL